MKRILLIPTLIISFMSNALGQHVNWGISAIDSTKFTFSPSDSFTHYMTDGNMVIDTSVTDTTATRLWEIGNTAKYFFADSSVAFGIMTDTLNEYPVNVNSWFTLKINGGGLNPIVGFTHKYETTSGKDGGIVEFSSDNGLTWQNALGQCNGDTDNSYYGTIYTDTFYTAADTLYTGESGFSGTSNGWITSWIQFFGGLPLRTTGNGCNFNSPIELRFRFISDSVADSLDGWIIGSVQVRENYYGSSVAKLNKPLTLSVYPNPSADAIFNFPVLNDEQNYNIEIINAIGARVMNIPYRQQVNLSGYAKGLYFYRVTNGTIHYTGQLITE